jgi:DNA-binding CsgD family transcriptional regulator
MLRTVVSERQELAPIFSSLELSPDPVFVTDRQNRIVFWNDSARRILGYESEEVVGRLCSELLKGCDSYGNRYCSEDCPIMNIASRGDIVQQFGLHMIGRDSHTVFADVAILQLRIAADEFLLVHMLRVPQGETHAQAATPTAPSPRPQLVIARESSDARARKLTTREVEVLGMIAAGRSTPEIAERLHISPLTTRDHIQHILEKLEVHSKAEAVAFAFQKNLI